MNCFIVLHCSHCPQIAFWISIPLKNNIISIHRFSKLLLIFLWNTLRLCTQYYPSKFKYRKFIVLHVKYILLCSWIDLPVINLEGFFKTEIFHLFFGNIHALLSRRWYICKLIYEFMQFTMRDSTIDSNPWNVT